MQGWVTALGLNDEHVRIREHEKAELSHYSDRTIDFEYVFPGPMGWKELYGLANRTDYDLRQHQEFSGEDLTWFDQESGTRFLPYVIEPTFGVDRTILVVLLDAYDEESTVDVNGKPDTRIVLRLDPKVAPYKAAILPLMKKPELTEIARGIFDRLQDRDRVPGRLRRNRQYRQALSAAGRNRHAVLFHGRSGLAGRRQSHGARPRHDGTGAHRHRRCRVLGRRQVK